MIVAMKGKIFPVLSLVVGASVAFAVAAVVESRSPIVNAASRFAELDPQQQEQIRAAARGLLERPAEDVARLKMIHTLVQEDAVQDEKLVQLGNWYRGLDADTRNTLKPDGIFAGDWQQAVEQKYFDTLNAEPHVLISLSMPEDWKNEAQTPVVLSYTEDQFFSFVDTLIPGNVPNELQWKLHGLTKPHEIALVKALWFSHELLGGNGSRFDFAAMMDAAVFVKKQIQTDLATSADLQTIQQWKESVFKRWGQGDQDEMRWDLILSWEVIRQGMIYMEKKIHKPDEAQRLAAISGLSRDEQLDLFSKDPANALKQLNEIALERSGNVEAADLLSEYRRVSNEFDKRLIYLYRRVGAALPPRGISGRRADGEAGRPLDFNSRPRPGSRGSR